MCDEETKTYLRRIADVQENGEYEYVGPFTIGGPQANSPYQLSSPWNTECEWALLAACGNTSTTSSCVIGSNNAGLTALGFSGGDVLSSSANGSISNPLPAFAMQFAQNDPGKAFTPVWFPLQGKATINMAVGAGSGGQVLATIAFRRRAIRNVPVRDRKSPVNNHRLQPRYGQPQEAQIVPAGQLEHLLEESREGRGIHGRPGTPAAKKRLFPF